MSHNIWVASRILEIHASLRTSYQFWSHSACNTLDIGRSRPTDDASRFSWRKVSHRIHKEGEKIRKLVNGALSTLFSSFLGCNASTSQLRTHTSKSVHPSPSSGPSPGTLCKRCTPRPPLGTHPDASETQPALTAPRTPLWRSGIRISPRWLAPSRTCASPAAWMACTWRGTHLACTGPSA